MYQHFLKRTEKRRVSRMHTPRAWMGRGHRWPRPNNPPPRSPGDFALRSVRRLSKAYFHEAYSIRLPPIGRRNYEEPAPRAAALVTKRGQARSDGTRAVARAPAGPTAASRSLREEPWASARRLPRRATNARALESISAPSLPLPQRPGSPEETDPIWARPKPAVHGVPLARNVTVKFEATAAPRHFNLEVL